MRRYPMIPVYYWNRNYTSILTNLALVYISKERGIYPVTILSQTLTTSLNFCICDIFHFHLNFQTTFFAWGESHSV